MEQPGECLDEKLKFRSGSLLLFIYTGRLTAHRFLGALMTPVANLEVAVVITLPMFDRIFAQISRACHHTVATARPRHDSEAAHGT